MITDTAKLNQRHLLMLDLYLQGKSNYEIARTVGMTPVQISIITNGPSFQHELALRRSSIAEKTDAMVAEKDANKTDPVMEKLRAGALRAAERLVLNLNDQNGSIANKAADSILNKAGYGDVKKLNIEEKQLQIVINASDASLLAETLRMINA